MPTINSRQSQDLNLEGTDSTNLPQLKLICGALVEGTKYSVIFMYLPRLKMMVCQEQATTETSNTGIDHSNDHHR